MNREKQLSLVRAWESEEIGQGKIDWHRKFVFNANEKECLDMGLVEEGAWLAQIIGDPVCGSKVVVAFWESYRTCGGDCGSKSFKTVDEAKSFVDDKLKKLDYILLENDGLIPMI